MYDVQPILHQQNAFKVFCLYLSGTRGTLTLPELTGTGFFFQQNTKRCLPLPVKHSWNPHSPSLAGTGFFLSDKSKNVGKFAEKQDAFHKLTIKFANSLFVNNIVFRLRRKLPRNGDIFQLLDTNTLN